MITLRLRILPETHLLIFYFGKSDAESEWSQYDIIDKYVTIGFTWHEKRLSPSIRSQQTLSIAIINGCIRRKINKSKCEDEKKNREIRSEIQHTINSVCMTGRIIFLVLAILFLFLPHSIHTGVSCIKYVHSNWQFSFHWKGKQIKHTHTQKWICKIDVHLKSVFLSLPENCKKKKHQFDTKMNTK